MTASRLTTVARTAVCLCFATAALAAPPDAPVVTTSADIKQLRAQLEKR